MNHAPDTARGFTLIETLVAISVLLVSLAGPLSIAAQALASAYYARDQITAFYLAQEAVEYVRVVRDQNFLDSNPGTEWLTNIEECIDADCAIDFPNFTHEVCSGTCPALKLSEVTGLYNLSTGDDSAYTRSLRLESIEGNPDEVTVRVRVSWESARIQRSFEVSVELFNWL